VQVGTNQKREKKCGNKKPIIWKRDRGKWGRWKGR